MLEIKRGDDLVVVDRVANNGSLNVENLSNRDAIKSAVETITNGGIVAAQVRGVFGLWCDAENESAVHLLHETKRASYSKTLSLMVPSSTIYPHVKMSAIHPDLKRIFVDSHTLSSHVGAVCHLRMPIKDQSVHEIPYTARSLDGDDAIIHNLDPNGHTINEFVERSQLAGVKFLGVSSMGISQIQPEIDNLPDAIDFCEGTANIDLLLVDNIGIGVDYRGSFPIVDSRSCEAVREGHIPIEYVERVLGVQIDTSRSKSSYYPQASVDVGRLNGMSGQELRQFLLSSMS